MSIGWASAVGLLGPLGVAVMLLVLAGISRRLGRVTRAARYYVLFILAALLILIGLGVRLLPPPAPEALRADAGLLMLYTGLPALGVSLGLFAAWHYWSWLLAERN